MVAWSMTAAPPPRAPRTARYQTEAGAVGGPYPSEGCLPLEASRPAPSPLEAEPVTGAQRLDAQGGVHGGYGCPAGLNLDPNAVDCKGQQLRHRR